MSALTADSCYRPEPEAAIHPSELEQLNRVMPQIGENGATRPRTQGCRRWDEDRSFWNNPAPGMDSGAFSNVLLYAELIAQ